MTPSRYRAVFVSDLHLGTKGCQAELFLDFLACHDADVLYLVGDVVDGWRLRSNWYWPDTHHQIVLSLLAKARAGTRLVYIPGNHDAFVRAYAGRVIGGVEVARSATHVTADGRRFHVTHGDEYDVVMQRARWLAQVGDHAYRLALFMNTHLNRIRRRFGLPYWSFSAWAKLKVKRAVNFIGSFETALATQAASGAFHGVICGHIHHAALHDAHGITYVNTGDFVESCTAVVELEDGRLELVSWQTLGQQTTAAPVDDIGDVALPGFA